VPPRTRQYLVDIFLQATDYTLRMEGRWIDPAPPLYFAKLLVVIFLFFPQSIGYRLVHPQLFGGEQQNVAHTVIITSGVARQPRLGLAPAPRAACRSGAASIFT
jgi:hypothetical protein